jgi:integrase
MAKAFTPIGIEKLKAGAERREIPDRTPLLYVIVQPTGRRRFALRYRFHGRSRKITLPTGIPLAEARKAAVDAALELDRGLDPAETRLAVRDKAALATRDTLRAICQQYLDREGDKLRSRRKRELLLARHVYPSFGSRPIASIRRGELMRLLDAIEDRSGTRTADSVLAAVRRIFNWWALRDESFVVPVIRGMSRYSIAGNARSRVLDDGELCCIWKASEAADVFGDLIRFLLLTGARCNEAAAMTWSEIDGDVWTLPPGRNKTGRELVRPLSRAALAIIEARPLLGVPFVFSAGVRPLHTWRPKLALDAASGVRDWVIHDLRRTARSLMSRAGVPSDHAERCLGHVLPGIRGTYDRHKFETEMRAAYEQLAALIERIVNPQPNVVPLRGAADA